MFIHRLPGNKGFCPAGKPAGQVFPLLLIFIVILIVGAKIAISAGKSAISKTNVSNGADACSLAAGSVMAGAFNELAIENRDMDEYYDYALANYHYLYNFLHECEGIADFSGYSDEGKTYAQQAKNKAYEALAKIDTTEEYCAIWVNQQQGAEKNFSESEDVIGAASFALTSAHFFYASYVLAYYLQQITDSFKQSQVANYCQARNLMDDSIEQAKDVGMQYAFNNSGTSSRSPNSDKFSYWMGTGKYKDDASFQDTTSNSTYDWNWDSKCGTSTCGATVTLEMPKLTDYKLRYTNKAYPDDKTFNIPSDVLNLIEFEETSISDDPFNQIAYKALTVIMVCIYNNLAINATEGQDIYQLTVYAQECCDAVDPPCDAHPNYYDPATNKKQALTTKQESVCAALDAILKNSDASSSDLTIATLYSRDADTYKNVWLTEAGLFVDSGEICGSYETLTGSVSDADEALGGFQEGEAGYDEANSAFEGASNELTSFYEDTPMIINIGDDPVFEGPPAAWQTKCSVSSFCENLYNEREETCSPYSATTSTSTAEFHGEGVLKDFKDNYETQIVSID
ncbi:MAG: hypothetical protein PHO34_05280 [Candidatus Omnitrophica bacterium]|nr:hypothetical protein [Candidatus Omnitrophota bacterium]